MVGMAAAITYEDVASLDRTPGQGNVFRIDTGHHNGTFITPLPGLFALSAQSSIYLLPNCFMKGFEAT